MLPDIRQKESLTRLSRLATVQRQDNACGGDGGVADVQSHTIASKIERSLLKLLISKSVSCVILFYIHFLFPSDYKLYGLFLIHRKSVKLGFCRSLVKLRHFYILLDGEVLICF